MLVYMFSSRYWHNKKRASIKFIHLHLFLTLISLPVLILWGLPLSLMSPVGNLVFNLFLTAFLSMSSLAFFTELLGIPNSWLMYALEQITNAWLGLLHYGSPRWIMGFSTPPLIVLIAIPLATFGVVHYRRTHHPLQNMRWLILIFFSTIGICALFQSKKAPLESLTNGHASITLVHEASKTLVVDAGALSATPSTPSWAMFTLTPALIKNTGSNQIDTLILCRPTARSFQAVTALMTTTSIKTIFLPLWHGHLPLAQWRAYRDFAQQAKDHQCIIKRIAHDKEQLIMPELQAIIKTTEQTVKSGLISYPRCTITCQIDNKKVTLYDSITKRCKATIKDCPVKPAPLKTKELSP